MDSFQICSGDKQKQEESMNDFENKLIEIFCHIDDFNKVFINDKGEIFDFVLTPGNVDDRQPLIVIFT